MSDLSESVPNLELLMDIPVKITAELNSTTKSIEEILQFEPGSVVRLDQLTASPIDLYANRKLVARGEVIAVGKNLGVKVTQLLS